MGKTQDDLLGTGPRSRRALGRGLDALLPAAERAGLQEIDIDLIEPNPNQPRRRFDRAALEELAASIREHGVVQPAVVTSVDGGRYRLIVGERRWQAARLAGLRRLPVVIKDSSEQQTLEIALIENVQRADLNPLEEAAAYQRLTQEFGLTQTEVAARVGKSRVAISNTMRLLALPEAIKRAVVEERISEGHARALLMLSNMELQLAALERVEREGLTVRQNEELVRRLSDRDRQANPEASRDPDIEAVEEVLSRVLGAGVRVRPSKRGGRIMIEYYSDDEFQSLYRRLVGEAL